MPLKLVVRTSDSSYPEVMGKLHSDVEQKRWNELFFVPPSLRTKRYFAVQVSSTCGYQQTFHGCCGAEFARMILLREMNFVACSDLWGLYVMSHQDYNWDASLSSVYRCLHMALVPFSDQSIVDDCRKWNSWTYIGTCRSVVIRMDLESCIRQYLRKHDTKGMNQFSTSPTVHWHVDAYMDSIIDESYKCDSVSTSLSFIEQHPNSATEEQQTSVLIPHEDPISLKTNQVNDRGAIEHSNQTGQATAREMGQWTKRLQKIGRTKPRMKTRRRQRECKKKAAEEKEC
jgi:hypothetical protein